MRKFKKRSFRFLTVIIGIYIILLIPDVADKSPLIKATQKPFTWNKDSLWLKLENDFRLAGKLQPEQLDSDLFELKATAIINYSGLENKILPATDSNLFILQNNFFALAPYIAIKQDEMAWYIEYYNQLRNFIKGQSQHWDMQQASSRNSIYSLLYGMRAALEETILQAGNNNIPAAQMVKNESSVTPAVTIFGIEAHSGDMLVSRGGAEVSALISRGNDYPGNFSHVALLYVEEKTKQPFIIEAHIEKGVAVANIKAYEKDKKLRMMVMRPRADLPGIIADPMLPHKAAKNMFDESFSRHIPYDFKMNYKDASAMFCSEVASYAYREKGIQIWQTNSTISSQGVVNWLHDFGVEYFITQMPSDLEYDPQLSVVAEWRDKETLFKDHLDNAVMDVLLVKADKGKTIGYNSWELPLARVIKAYSMMKNYFGKPAMIPEGMSATQALKNQSFVAMHVKLKEKTVKLANEFYLQNHYQPPYWQLVKFAEQSAVIN